MFDAQWISLGWVGTASGGFGFSLPDFVTTSFHNVDYRFLVRLFSVDFMPWRGKMLLSVFVSSAEWIDIR